MSSILLITWDGGGNVPPALGLAAELSARGHDVRVMGHPRQAAAIEAAGHAFVPYRSARSFDSRETNSPVAFVAMFGDRAMGSDVLAELAARPADAVVVDCMLFGPMEALARAGVPFIALAHTFDSYCTGRWLAGPIGLGLRLKRFQPRRILDRASMRLVATLESLDLAARQVAAPDVRYVGPIVSGLPATPVPERPTVLVSLSTIGFPHMAGVLQRVLDAIGTLPVDAIITTGPALAGQQLSAPPNATLHEFVPHAEVLPRVSLLIGHGGHATTMAALAHDVPVLVLPMHPMLDQKMIGSAVEAAGAGRLLPKKATAAQIAEAAAALLTEGPHRVAAAELGTVIRAARGAATAADLVESVIPQHV